jgi:hypothetical protein
MMSSSTGGRRKIGKLGKGSRGSISTVSSCSLSGVIKFNLGKVSVLTEVVGFLWWWDLASRLVERMG